MRRVGGRGAASCSTQYYLILYGAVDISHRVFDKYKSAPKRNGKLPAAHGQTRTQESPSLTCKCTDVVKVVDVDVTDHGVWDSRRNAGRREAWPTVQCPGSSVRHTLSRTPARDSAMLNLREGAWLRDFSSKTPSLPARSRCPVAHLPAPIDWRRSEARRAQA